MGLQKWKRLTSTHVVKNPWWSYGKDEFELPNGTKGEYHYVHTNGASLIVPVLNDGRVVLVNQYRYLCDRESLEFPCGGLKDGWSYDKTAVMELEEEAGYIARDWRLVGEFNPFNGVTDEMCRVYIARNLSQGQPKPDETEEFEKVTMRPEELEAKIISGVIWDGMTIAAWTIAKPHI
ncbi:MAG: NUDIX hydrolase [Ignavibacteriales bacterium]|nr:NUDIX hydrolase [Ignavibacteriales bacterium]